MRRAACATLPGVLALALVLPPYGPGAARAIDYPVFLEMHGFLRWAANRCGFTQYNPAVVEDARLCFDRLGGAVAAPRMYAGRERFEREISLRSLDAVCAEIGRRFPQVVR